MQTTETDEIEDDIGAGGLLPAPRPQAVSVSRMAHTIRAYRRRVCAVLPLRSCCLLRWCCELLIRAFRLRGPEPGAYPRRFHSRHPRPFQKETASPMNRHAARGTRRMTLERVRSGFLHIGISLRSRSFAVCSELLTRTPGGDDERPLTELRPSLV